MFRLSAQMEARALDPEAFPSLSEAFMQWYTWMRYVRHSAVAQALAKMLEEGMCLQFRVSSAKDM